MRFKPTGAVGKVESAGVQAKEIVPKGSTSDKFGGEKGVINETLARVEPRARLAEG